MAGADQYEMKRLIKRARLRMEQALRGMDKELDAWWPAIDDLTRHLRMAGALDRETKNKLKRVNKVCMLLSEKTKIAAVLK